MAENEEQPLEPKWVGKGGLAGAISRDNPQWWLAGSLHPYAPFPGNALKWNSFVYDDGTTYEGLMMLDVPHNKGVLVFGNGLGGGIQKADRGDRYEGEFDSGFAHGMGQYTSTRGKVYRGEWLTGQRHGCGVEYDTTPFIKRVDAGMDPDQAWTEAQPEIERSKRYGTWLRDTFFSGPDDTGRWCHIAEIKGVEEEVRQVLSKARMFQFKPDGEVTFRFAQDGNGMPAPTMQDPLHYPHGTKFLAPGPLGQCHPIPDNEPLKAAMAAAADQHARIYQSYNLPYEITPGSLLDKAAKHWRKKQARRQRALEKKLQREQQRIRRMEAADAAARGEGRKAAAEPRKEQEVEEPPSDEEDEGGIDEDDLIASTAGVEAVPPEGAAAEQQQRQVLQQPGFAPPSVLASASLGLSRAAVLVQRAFHAAAVRAPPLRCLTRPQRAAQ